MLARGISTIMVFVSVRMQGRRCPVRRVPWVAPLLGIVFILLATFVSRSQSRKSLSEGRPPMQIPTGNRDLVTEVSGGYEAQYFFRRLEKPPDWEQNLEIICELKKKSVEQAIDRLETNLAELKTQEMEQSYYDAVVRRHHTVGLSRNVKANQCIAVQEGAGQIASPFRPLH